MAYTRYFLMRVRASIVISFVIILCPNALGAAPRDQDQIHDWKISGRVVMLKGEKIPPSEQITAKLSCWRLRESLFSLYPRGRFAIIPTPPPQDPELRKLTFRPWNNALFKNKRARFMALYQGRFTNLVTFTPKENHFRLKDVVLKFAPPVDYVLRARILDPETGKGVPNLRVKVRSWGGNNPKEKFGYWKFGEAVSDKRGIIRFAPLPEREFTIIDANSYVFSPGIWPLGPYGTPQYARWPKSLPKDKAGKLKPEELPAVYYVPPGKGLLWTHGFFYRTGPGNRREVPTGTVLQFRGLKDDHDQPWPKGKEPHFEVTVGKHGLVKTPVVPEGRYEVRAKNGLFENERWPIHGLGSLSVDERKPLPQVGPLDHFYLWAPGMAKVGQPFEAVVYAKDAANRTKHDFRGQVRLGVARGTPGSEGPPRRGVFINGTAAVDDDEGEFSLFDAGVHCFSVTAYTKEKIKLKVSGEGKTATSQLIFIQRAPVDSKPLPKKGGRR